MRIHCLECRAPIDVDFSQVTDAFIPPDLCVCSHCGVSEKSDHLWVLKISYQALREKEKEEISRHRWFMSEKLGYDVGSQTAEDDWKKNHEDDFLRQWYHRQEQ